MKLPMISGRLMGRSHADFERACLVHIAEEQDQLLPDNSLIALLADAVRVSRECVDKATIRGKNEERYFELIQEKQGRKEATRGD